MKTTPLTLALRHLSAVPASASFPRMKNRRPSLQPTALALALGALCLSVAAQAQQQASAALPQPQDETFSSKNIAQQTRGMTEAPLAYTSFAAMAESRALRLVASAIADIAKTPLSRVNSTMSKTSMRPVAKSPHGNVSHW